MNLVNELRGLIENLKPKHSVEVFLREKGTATPQNIRDLPVLEFENLFLDVRKFLAKLPEFDAKMLYGFQTSSIGKNFKKDLEVPQWFRFVLAKPFNHVIVNTEGYNYMRYGVLVKGMG